MFLDRPGHYNRPHIFQLHNNRDVPRLYTVHVDPVAGALDAPKTRLREISVSAPALGGPEAARPALGVKPPHDSGTDPEGLSPSARFGDGPSGSVPLRRACQSPPIKPPHDSGTDPEGLSPMRYLLSRAERLIVLSAAPP